MAANDKQYLDETGLNNLWSKLRKELPFHENHGNGTADGWAKLLDITCTSSMNRPLAINIISQGDTPSVAVISFVDQVEATPDVSYFKHVVPEFNTGSNVGYTYSDSNGVRTYTFWKKRGGKDNSVSVHVDCVPEYIHLISFPADQTQSDTEPTGITYASKAYDTISAKTPQSAKGTATKVPQITTNSLGQVTAITEVDIQSGSTSQKGLVKLNDSVDSTSTTEAATANALKTAYTLAAGKQDPITFDGTYDATTNKAATVSTVTNAVNGLDVSDLVQDSSGSMAGKTLKTLSEADGKISATFQNISITKSQVSDFGHTHGQLTNDGAITAAGENIGNNDTLVFVDSSDSSKIKHSSIKFDGATTSKALTQKGTWEDIQSPITFDGTYDASTNPAATEATVTNAINALDSNQTSADGTNVQVKVTQADGKISAVNITTDNTENRNNKVTSWASTTSDTSYPSEKLVKDSLDAKGSLITSWQSTPDDTHYPSEKLVKNALDNLPPGTTVKGDAESSYRSGEVNLTPANLGISATSTSVTVGSTTFNQYTHPTTNGNKHIPADGTTGNFLKYASAGTAQWSSLEAADIPNISADKITSGTLPVTRGGTGGGDAATARTNLDVYSKSETESLLNGKIVIVTELPTTGEAGKTYYVKNTSSTAVDKYDEYIWAVDAGATTESWIHVGEQSLDLANYVNTLSSSGSGSVITSISKSGNTITATAGNISLDNLSNWASTTDVTVDSVVYHTYWPTAPTASNEVYGLAIKDGKLFQVHSSQQSYTVRPYDQDTNTTYTQAQLGQGYGLCSTGESTAAKVVALSGYELETNGIVAVKFTHGLCASATLSINGKAAKPVYVNGAAVDSSTCTAVLAGDIAVFMYDGSYYQFIGTDRAAMDSITGLSVSGTTVTYTRADGSTGTVHTQDTTYVFDGTYNASTNKAATVATVTGAIASLDVSDITGMGAGKTIATLTETDGKVAATFQDISITKSQVSDFPAVINNLSSTSTTDVLSAAQGKVLNDGKQNNLPTSGTASSTYAINISGNAATASSVAWANVTNKTTASTGGVYGIVTYTTVLLDEV